MHSDREFAVEELAYNQLKLNPKEQLTVGEVGYIVAGIKSVQAIELGGTITIVDHLAAKPVSGYQEAKQVVFSFI